MPSEAQCLAPLQIIMLRDTLAGGEAGAHVEQVEMVFTEAADGERVAAAWRAIVAATEVLRMAFLIKGAEPVGWALTEAAATENWEEPSPDSLEKWLAADRVRPLLAPDCLPWRVIYWPLDRRFIWTLHHALLDGRSITRILRNFFQILRDGLPPQPTAVTRWTPPDDLTNARAAAFFQQEFAGLSTVEGFHPSPVPLKVTRCLGDAASVRLEAIAETMAVSVATLLTWTWGQAVSQASGEDIAVVEQVRCGAPQQGKTGFTLNTLPLAIRRATAEPVATQLTKFRAHLLAMRDFECVAPYDLPPAAVGATNHPWSSVIMIERGTLHYLTAGGTWIESITLHEWPGETLTAAAYHLPDLRLAVEGPGNARLLELWACRLLELIH